MLLDQWKFLVNKFILLQRAHKMHGPVLTDVTATSLIGKKSFLSLKYGGTLTFMNPGSKTLVFRWRYQRL